MSRLLTEEEVIAKSKRNRETRQSVRRVGDEYFAVVAEITIPDKPKAPVTIKEKKVAANRANKPKVVCLTEHQEQCKVIEWCDKHPLACMIHATPNGLRTSIRTAIKAKKEGLRKGYPDLSLDVARNGFHGLRIELKRLRGSSTSEEQDDWIDFLRAQGYKAEICRGADDAIKTIQEYLQEPLDNKGE